MRWAYKFSLRLRSLFRRQRVERELADEMQFHLQAQVDEYVAEGMSPQDARQAALRAIGGLEQIKEQCRAMRNTNFVEHFFQDLRFGFRMLRRSPVFSVLAVLCLTLGIGANTAVFSWIEGTLLRPYPKVAHQERLFVLAGTARGTSDYDEISVPDFLDLQRSSTLVDSFIAEKITGATLSIGDRAERAVGSMVSANYFDALGIRPYLGRTFLPGEDTGRNAHPVVVISYQFWQDRFHGDRNVIGATQLMNSVPHTIVGVAQKGFYGTFVGYSWQFWVPLSMQESFDSSGYKLEDRGASFIEPFVRLKPGVTLEQAQAEISTLAQRLEREYPDTNRGRGLKLVPLWQSPFNAANSVLPTLKVTVVVVFLVLLIACANVSNLLLVRAFARRQEMTIRLAIGAGRGRLVRQLLTEGLILAVLSAAGGILLAYWCRNLLVLFVPPRTAPLYIPGNLDWHVLVLSVVVCLLSIFIFGLVPAMQASKLDLAGALKSESGAVVSARGRSRVRSTMVLLQVALSFILLVGAGLLVQSVHRIRNTNPGFASDGLLTTAINLFAAGYDAPRARNFQDQLMDRIQTMSGVQSATYARIMPFSFITYSSAPVSIDGYQAAADELPTVEYNQVGPTYFMTMGIPLVSGREFTPNDDENAPLVAVVNDVMAAKYWRGEDPVGKRLQVKGRSMRVVGVARLAKYGNLLEKPKPFFYVPLRQNFSALVSLMIRTRLDPGSMATALVREVHALDPELAPYQVIPMREQIDRQAAAQLIAVKLLGVFGGLAVLLAAVGLYGVMSYAVSQSTRELGLRMALGATASNVLRLVMSHGLALSATGVVLGAAVALLCTRLLGYLLYQVSPRDPLAFASAFLVMAVAVLLACFFPAWRATRTNPVRALRE